MSQVSKTYKKRAVSLLLAVMVFLSVLPCAFATATSLDPQKPCSVTLSVNDLELIDSSVDHSEISQALAKLDFKADVWLVATVDADVNFTLVEAFSKGIEVQGYKLDDLNTYKKAQDDPELNKKAELAAAIYGAAKGIRKDADEDAPQGAIPPDHVLEIKNGSGTLEGLQAGYYLLVPDEVADEEYRYTFAPSLVSIPYIGNVGEEGSETVEDWIYNVNAKLKPEREMRRGNAVIHKHLTGYNETLEGADFVFTAAAYKNEKLVYSNAIILHFDGTEYDKEYVIYDLPAGSVVEVSEVYTGSCYTLDSSSVTPDNIVVACDTPETADRAIRFYFENKPNHDTSYGSAVLNHYETMTNGDYGHSNDFPDSTGEPNQNK